MARLKNRYTLNIYTLSYIVKTPEILTLYNYN